MMITETGKAEIYREFYGKIYGYMLGKINHPQIAEDLTADVFVKVYKNLEGFDETKAGLSTWIYTITRNTLTDWFRTRKQFGEMPELTDNGKSVEDAIVNAETLAALAEGLASLEQRERDIIVMRFYQGRTLKEIAAQMGISYTYVKVLQNKAFARLKTYLGKQVSDL